MSDLLPLVSICIPAYNCAQYVLETIECLQNQTYQNIEIIIVNDGSKDNTLEVLKSISDSRVKIFSIQNSGASTARNKAFSYSNGDFIKFMDADDILNLQSIEEQIKLAIENKSCIISGKWGRFNNNDLYTFQLNPQPCWKTLLPLDWLEKSWGKTQPMMQPGIFLIPRKFIFDNGLWNEKLSLIDDYEYGVRILLKAEKIVFCSNSILHYRSAIANNLSGQKSYKAAQSALLAIQLAEKEMLNAENSQRMKQINADVYFQFVIDFYPQYKDLTNIAEKALKNLPNPRVSLQGGKLLMIMKFIFGWKLAKRLRMIL